MIPKIITIIKILIIELNMKCSLFTILSGQKELDKDAIYCNDE